MDDLVGCSAGCCSASDDAFDAVFGHEIEAALGCGHDGLPPLDGVFRSRYEGDFFEFVSSVGDPPAGFRNACHGAKTERLLKALYMTSTCSSKSSRLASWSMIGLPKVSTSREWYPRPIPKRMRPLVRMSAVA